jgi:hypothetical protein
VRHTLPESTTETAGAAMMRVCSRKLGGDSACT